MFTNTKCSIYAGQDKVYTESVCLSTDVKPTTGIANGSTCIEMNTGKKFMFNEDSGEWVEVPSSGGGGGGDFSTAQVTVTFETEATLFTPYCYDHDGFAGIDIAILDSGTYTVALYKGAALASVQRGQIAGTGNIEIEGNEAIITGDCTITIS